MTPQKIINITIIWKKKKKKKIEKKKDLRLCSCNKRLFSLKKASSTRLASALLFMRYRGIPSSRFLFGHVFIFVNPVVAQHTLARLKKSKSLKKKNIPTVADHAHTVRFCCTVKFSSLFHILFASHTLSIAKSRLCHRIRVSPLRSDFKTM